MVMPDPWLRCGDRSGLAARQAPVINQAAVTAGDGAGAGQATPVPCRLQ